MGSSKAAARCSKPNSCCPGRFRRRWRRRGKWPNSSTRCGWPMPRPRCSRLSPAAANGSRSRYQPIRFTSTSFLTAEKKFWRCVESGEPPRLFGVDSPRARIEAVRIVDMSASNAWAELSGVFRRTREAHLEHENAKTELKALMPEDAKEAVGHGIRARRSKSGAVSFDVMSMEGSHAPLQ